MVRRFVTVIVGMAVGIAAIPVAAQVVSSVQFVPVVARSNGVGSLWRTDLSITNLTNSAVQVTAAYLPADQANFPPLKYTHQMTMQSKQTILVQDVVGKWFPQFGDQTKGALLVYTNAPAFGKDLRDMIRAQDKGTAAPALAVTSRTYNATDPNSTFGQTVPADPYSYIYGIAVGEMTGMEQDDRFRTNIGVVNLSGLTAPVQITVYGAAGQLLAQKTENIEGYSLRQWNLGHEFGVSNLQNGLVEVKIDPSVANQDPCGTTAGSLSPMIVAYFSKNDNTSQDAVFGVAQVDWRQFAVECQEGPMDGCPGLGQ